MRTAVRRGIHARAVGVNTRRGIAHEGTLTPGTPQRTDAGEPLLGAVVGVVVTERRRGREVPRATGVGDDVEPEPIGAQVLQRRELPRGRVGQGGGGVHGRDHAEVLRRLKEVGRE